VLLLLLAAAVAPARASTEEEFDPFFHGQDLYTQGGGGRERGGVGGWL
jgi:hypothetical protein